MASRLQEIEARYVGEKHRWGDTVIASFQLCNGSIAAAQTVGVTSDRISAKGDADVDELQRGQTYRLYGSWQTYRDEKQFIFKTFVPCVAHDRDGVVAYLEAAGRGSGVGIGTARKAWDKWSGDAVRIIRENPRVLLELNKRLTDEELTAIGDRLKAQEKPENAQIEVTNLLAGRGFPKSLFRKTIREWGNKAAIRIRRDPYQLMRFRGCGFKLCDKLYLELGLNPSALRRQALCAWYAIASNNDGHVWFPIDVAKHAVRQAIGREAQPDRAIELAERLGRLSPDHYGALATIRTRGRNGAVSEFGDCVWVAEGRKARQEAMLAELVVEALNEVQPQTVTQYEDVETIERQVLDHARCRRCSRMLTAPQVHIWNGQPFGPTCIQSISDGTDVEVVSLHEWLDRNPEIIKHVQEIATGTIELPEFSLWPDVSEIELLTDHQRENLDRALVGRIAIFGGSPGTGKSHTTAQLVKTLLKTGRVSQEDIAVGTPTGKASVRFNEALSAARVPVRARTWHSLLGRGESDTESGIWSFQFNRSNPWPFKIIIGDEESMKDLALMCAVMSARARGCHFLLVGDINQLPPVGSGAPLRDMIAAGLPYGELTAIMRNSGGIVEACAAIRDGKHWSEGSNLKITAVATPAAQIEAMVDAIWKYSSQTGCSPVWQCQVICAVNAKSMLSRKVLNQRLQEEFNPNPVVPGSPFRVKDKVVCLENGWYPKDQSFDASKLDRSYYDEDDQKIYVANGELGSVRTVGEKYFTVGLINPTREIVVPRGKQDEGDSADDADEKASTGCKFDLGYALSCHRMQGSEVECVIGMIDEYPGARMVCSREWLYTLISRGKAYVELIGKKAVADSMCKRVALSKRKTFLRELILKKRAERLLEVM